AGDELVWLLRRLNEEWGTTIVLVEHRLERCLAAADRVLAFEHGAIACDQPPRGFLEWAAERAPALATPGARLFARAGLRPAPSGVKEARATLRAHGLLDAPASGAPREPAALAAVAGTLFQDPETQVVLSTVRAELALPLENRGHGAAAVARGVEEAALALGIGDLLDRPTHELSGGELQRVALGASLAGRPQVVLLDEPTSQLDPVAGDELVWLLRRLNEEWGTTIVLVEHRLERCLAAADRVLGFERGAIACDQPPRGFLEWAAERAPALATPGARLFARAGLRPAPSGVKEARATLRAHGLLDAPASGAPREPAAPPPRRARRGLRRRATAVPAPTLRFRGVWHERPGGRAVLRGVDLALAPGERVALMGRNGAGKSTLLRHANGLLKPTRGRVEAAGRVALLLQNPNDYFLADRVADELDAAALERAGLAAVAGRHPRDLAGGERQRLALAIVSDGAPAAAICLDEPTRGMDRAAKGDLAADLRAAAAAGSAVLVATHDPEFAALTAERVVLLADGRVIADGPVAELLSGGWYFATETARIVDGALLPEDGADLLRARMTVVIRP
ncbi:MAG TPA: ATP-binding cassette domain-containing protein, partial [Solirubrobacteraceae bacterium]|nr:ATP-binding cassette domain-containing protein [Solirubrobacteraceae bacterium]